MEGVRTCRKRLLTATANKEKAKENEESQISKRWTQEEKKKIFWCLKVYGHKDLDKIQSKLPGRSKDDIRKFLIVVHSTARQRQTSKSDLKYWLSRSISETEKSNVGKMNDFYYSAQIMKFLSIDELLESHPAAKSSEGIDFSAAYRLIYQSLMGYPLQPVNQATADFISESLKELIENKNCNFIRDLLEFLNNKYKKGETKLSNGKNTENLTSSPTKNAVYLKKRCANDMVDAGQPDVPPLKVVVTEEATNSLKNLKCYSLAVDDGKKVSTVVVPVAAEKPQYELEGAASRLWNNVEFNPLGLPRKWCRLSSTSD